MDSPDHNDHDHGNEGEGDGSDVGGIFRGLLDPHFHPLFAIAGVDGPMFRYPFLGEVVAGQASARRVVRQDDDVDVKGFDKLCPVKEEDLGPVLKCFTTLINPVKL